MKKTTTARKLLNITTILFWCIMLFFTLCSESLYYATLPKVEVATVNWRTFSVTVESEEGVEVKTTRKVLAIPKEAVHDGVVYVLEKAEEELLAIASSVLTGEEQDGYVEILEGIKKGNKVVCSSDRPLVDGDVVMEKE